MRNVIKRHDHYYVYIVQCINGTYYTGYTNNLENRIKEHNSGHGAKYLRGKGPVKLVYAKEYRYYKNVLRAERNLKKLTDGKEVNKIPKLNLKLKSIDYFNRLFNRGSYDENLFSKNDKYEGGNYNNYTDNYRKIDKLSSIGAD